MRYGERMRLGLAALMMLLVVGCGDAGFEAETDDFIDQDTPPGNCSASTGLDPCPNPGTSGSPEGGPCFNTRDCAGGNACVAPYDSGDIGDFTCTSQCIELQDDAAWCLDASACCDPNASCRRGLCVAGPEQQDESGTGSSSGDSGSTGGSDSSSGGSGTAASSGSDTGAATGTTGMR